MPVTFASSPPQSTTPINSQTASPGQYGPSQLQPQLQSQSQSQFQSQASSSIPDPLPDTRPWWSIRCILGERKRNGRIEYKVDWEPDAATGETWPPDWRPVTDVTHKAREEWNRFKDHQRQRLLSEAESSATRHKSSVYRRSRIVLNSPSQSQVEPSTEPLSLSHNNNHRGLNPAYRDSVIYISSQSEPSQLELTSDSVPAGQDFVIEAFPPSPTTRLEYLSVYGLSQSQSLPQSQYSSQPLLRELQDHYQQEQPQSQPQQEIPDSQEDDTASLCFLPSSALVVPPSLATQFTTVERGAESRAVASPSTTISSTANTGSGSAALSGTHSHTPGHEPALPGPAPSSVDPPASGRLSDWSSYGRVFLSQIRPQIRSQGAGSTSLLSSLRPLPTHDETENEDEHVSETSIASVTVHPGQFATPAVPGSMSELPLPAHAQLDSHPPNGSAASGHKRNLSLSSPGSGSQLLVKRPRILDVGLQSPTAADMDLDESAPLSSVDEMLNAQTPYDPARTIIVTADEIDGDMHDPIHNNLHKAVISEPFSILQPETLMTPVPPVDMPMISGIDNPAALDFGHTVNPNLILPEQPPAPLTIAPSDISNPIDIPPYDDHLHGPASGLDTSVLNEGTVESPKSTDDDDDDHYEGEREFLVTLPFSSSQRPLYLEIVESFKPQNKEFSTIFHQEELQEPRPSLVHQIDEEFVTLLDLCDYPHELASKSLSRLTEKEVQHYAVESNAKFNFLWEFLQALQDTDKKVLIVARSEKLLQLLKTIIPPSQTPLSTPSEGDGDSGADSRSFTVSLALFSTEIKDPMSSFDVVIGFDYMFRFSAAARQIEALAPHKQPFVLSLMMLHSIEHLDVSMMKSRNALEHKNAVIYGLVQGRELIRSPRLSDYEKPHQIAFHFADQVKEPNPTFAWDSQPFSDNILNTVYISQQTPHGSGLEPVSQLKPITSRKRKPTSELSESSKRPKISEIGCGSDKLLVDADRHAAVVPFVKILGLDILDSVNPWDGHDLLVPGRLLNCMYQKSNDDQRIIAKERGAASDLRKVVQSMSKQLNDYSSTLEQENRRLREAIGERANFERERDSVTAENAALKAQLDALKAQLQESQARETTLGEEITALKAAAAETMDRAFAETQAGEALATTKASLAESTARATTAEASLAALEKRFASQATELDFVRQTYQDASNAVIRLRNGSASLAKQLADTQRSASENILHIHDTNAKTQADMLMRMVEEARSIQREREADLERVREELRVFKNGRRETRQSSAPRSPRVGMMSPRNAGFRNGNGNGNGATSSSRGTSPLDGPGGSNIQYFNSQQAGNGRWGHLKD